MVGVGRIVFRRPHFLVLKTTYSGRIISAIRRIPRGKVATYGQIAALAGNPRAARTVAWLLHSSSGTAGLPWHRVVNAQGRISLKPGRGYEEQRAMLEAEGVRFSGEGAVDLKIHHWRL